MAPNFPKEKFKVIYLTIFFSKDILIDLGLIHREMNVMSDKNLIFIKLGRNTYKNKNYTYIYKYKYPICLGEKK